VRNDAIEFEILFQVMLASEYTAGTIRIWQGL